MKDAQGHGSNARAEGFAAGNGDGTARNPYSFFSQMQQRGDWDRGWTEGMGRLITDQNAANALGQGHSKAAPTPIHGGAVAVAQLRARRAR